jgi:hypothetical protein
MAMTVATTAKKHRFMRKNNATFYLPLGKM